MHSASPLILIARCSMSRAYFMGERSSRTSCWLLFRCIVNIRVLAFCVFFYKKSTEYEQCNMIILHMIDVLLKELLIKSLMDSNWSIFHWHHILISAATTFENHLLPFIISNIVILLWVTSVRGIIYLFLTLKTKKTSPSDVNIHVSSCRRGQSFRYRADPF